jgi:hypothetical protein
MSAGVAEMDATSELTDVRGVWLEEMSGAALMAINKMVARVIPESDVVAPGPRFSSNI